MSLLGPRFLIQGRLHRGLRRLYLHFGWHTLINAIFAAVSLVATFLLTIWTLPNNYKPAGWSMLAVLIILMAVKAIAALGQGAGEERLRQSVLYGCLTLIHKHVLADNDNFRLTLFIRDPVFCVREESLDGRTSYEDIIVPYVRLQSGQAGPQDFDSKVYYPRSSRAVTAVAWRKAMDAKVSLRGGEFKAFIYAMPRRFGSRAEMNQHFADALKIEHRVLERISDFMIEVVQILSFPLVDNDNNFLALLSIDSKEYFSTGAALQAGQNAPVAVDAEKLRGYLNGLRAMLMKVHVRR